MSGDRNPIPGFGLPPTLDEIAQFSRNEDGETDNHVDLSIIAESSRKAAVLVLHTIQSQYMMLSQIIS